MLQLFKILETRLIGLMKKIGKIHSKFKKPDKYDLRIKLEKVI